MLLYVYLFLLLSVLAMAGKDYYKLLGVGRTAKDAEIKRAFRKLALKYHPDRNKEKDAEVKFREIAEAYEVLSDPQKRRQYDQLGDSTFSQGGGGFSGGFGGGFKFDFDNFFKEFDESFKQRRQGARQAGGGNRFKFGDGFFNFDDLWGDDDGIFSKKNNGAGQQKRAGGASLFDFDFGDMFGGGSLFGDDLQNMQRNVHQKAHSSSHSGRSGGEARQSCRTVTQRFGNTVTTFTQCS